MTVWIAKRNGEKKRLCIRTTRDRYVAFAPLAGGSKWKTLDDAELVAVSAVDSREDPRNIEVYLLPANDVRKRLNEAYRARSAAGQVIDFGFWLSLDSLETGSPKDVGTGLADKFEPIAIYPLERPFPAGGEARQETAESDPGRPKTIAEVIAWARGRISEIAGVSPSAVKLDLKLEI